MQIQYSYREIGSKRLKDDSSYTVYDPANSRRWLATWNITAVDAVYLTIKETSRLRAPQRQITKWLPRAMRVFSTHEFLNLTKQERNFFLLLRRENFVIVLNGFNRNIT